MAAIKVSIKVTRTGCNSQVQLWLHFSFFVLLTHPNRQGRSVHQELQQTQFQNHCLSSAEEVGSGIVPWIQTKMPLHTQLCNPGNCLMRRIVSTPEVSPENPTNYGCVKFLATGSL